MEKTFISEYSKVRGIQIGNTILITPIIPKTKPFEFQTNHPIWIYSDGEKVFLVPQQNETLATETIEEFCREYNFKLPKQQFFIRRKK